MKTPNILFIFSDQHAHSVLGCYGDKVVQTPNLDRLAREGVRFENAYCPSPICAPSRMSLLTGRWPYRQECWVNDDMLRSDIPTWLHSAGAAGYDPVLIGRMHAIGPDQLHGYVGREIGDHSSDYPGVATAALGSLTGTSAPDPISLEKAGSGMAAYQTKDADTTKAAADWLRETGAARKAEGNPFCLTVGLMLPHPPYVVDQEAFDIYDGKVPPPRLDKTAADHPWHNWWRESRGINDVSDEARDTARAAYWGLVQRTDEAVGSLLAALEEIGALDDTLIVYSSDHGDHLGERELWWKHTFFDEAVKVPLIMRLPKTLPAGESRSQLVNLVDLGPTLLEAIDAPALPHTDGRSFWSVAQNPEAPWVNRTFSEYCTDAVPDWTGGRAVQQRMIRQDQWKLVFYDREPPQLFNLENDPQETINLADDPVHAKIRDEMLKDLVADWSPSAIAKRMNERRIEKDIIANWATRVQPASSYLWPSPPDCNWLD